MYNYRDCGEQLEDFHRNLFGNKDPRDDASLVHARYTLPKGVRVIPCKPNEQGEWVPCSDLEKSVKKHSK